MSINSKSCRSDAVVRTGIAARLAEMQARADKALDGPWERRVAPDDPATMADKSAWVDGTLRDNGEPIHLAIAAPPNDELAYVVPFLTGDGPTSRANAEFIAHARADVPALTLAVESVLDYVARCEESGITMQPGDIRRLIAAALGVTA